MLWLLGIIAIMKRENEEGKDSIRIEPLKLPILFALSINRLCVKQKD
jgi:hypothetical protein